MKVCCFPDVFQFAPIIPAPQSPSAYHKNVFQSIRSKSQSSPQINRLTAIEITRTLAIHFAALFRNTVRILRLGDGEMGDLG